METYITTDLFEEYKRLLEKYHYYHEADFCTEILGISDKPNKQFYLITSYRGQTIPINNAELADWLKRLLTLLNPYIQDKAVIPKKVDSIRILSGALRTNTLHIYIRPTLYDKDSVEIDVRPI